MRLSKDDGISRQLHGLKLKREHEYNTDHVAVAKELRATVVSPLQDL